MPPILLLPVTPVVRLYTDSDRRRLRFGEAQKTLEQTEEEKEEAKDSRRRGREAFRQTNNCLLLLPPSPGFACLHSIFLIP